MNVKRYFKDGNADDRPGCVIFGFPRNCPGPDKSRSQGQRGAKKPYFRPYFRFDPKLFLKNAKIFLFFFGVPA
jgi:hypothetical protein